VGEIRLLDNLERGKKNENEKCLQAVSHSEFFLSPGNIIGCGRLQGGIWEPFLISRGRLGLTHLGIILLKGTREKSDKTSSNTRFALHPKSQTEREEILGNLRRVKLMKVNTQRRGVHRRGHLVLKREWGVFNTNNPRQLKINEGKIKMQGVEQLLLRRKSKGAV